MAGIVALLHRSSHTEETSLKQITPQMLASLSADARASARRRANLNLHPQLDDPIQRLAIAMEPDTYVRPHRHPQTWEMLHPLAESFLVLEFDDAGTVCSRTLLGLGENEARLIELPAGRWHAVLSRTPGAVIFEVKHGPYQALGEADLADWSPAAESAEAAELLAWYAQAQVGARWARPD